ncbi:S41 family peptidase [Mucilaginibacter sp.]|uniref:S41 family peptidase n=1 Tax=Mucilaginibacter sp. TaxID=1882438 RepID=UPI003D0A98F9
MIAKAIFKTVFCLLIACEIISCNAPVTKNASKPISDNIDTADKKLTVKSMHDDLFILWSAIKEIHPGYGFYTTTDSLQRAYDKMYTSINSPLNEGQFMANIYPFLCNLRCGHTQLKHAVNYKPSPNIKVPHLPFEVLVRNHKAWVTTHITPGLTTGDEIISINGIPVNEIIDHGAELYCGDGYNETFKELFLSEYDGFEDACNKYYHWPGPYRIQLLNKRGAVQTLQVNAVSTDASQWPLNNKATDNYTDWTTARNTGALSLRFLNNSKTALFESKPFAYADTLVYKEAFKQIQQRGIKNLILDMRHNTGGDLRVAIQLLSYLADAPFNIVNDIKSRVPNPSINHFEKYFDTARTSSFNQGFKPGVKEGQWFHIEAKPVFGKLYGPLPLTKANHFNGNLFVLIDGATFSSAALFSVALKAQRKNVIFIGRETAGAEEGCNGGTIQELTLPNTKIRVDFPWMRVVSAAKKPSRGPGLMPAYTVNYTPGDVVAKNDPDLKKALSLIK